MLGMTRTTGTPGASAASIRAVVTPAATETTRWSRSRCGASRPSRPSTSCGLTASRTTRARAAAAGQVDQVHAVPLRQLGAPLGAALADDDVARSAAPDHPRQQRLPHPATTDDGETAAPRSAHREPSGRPSERADGAGPGHDGHPHRRAGGGQSLLLRGADSPGHDVLPAVGRAAVPGRPLSGDGDQSRIGRGHGGPAVPGHEDVDAADEGQPRRRPRAGPQPHPPAGEDPAARLRGGFARPHDDPRAGVVGQQRVHLVGRAVEHDAQPHRGGAGGQLAGLGAPVHGHGELAVPRRSLRTHPVEQAGQPAPSSSRLPGRCSSATGCPSAASAAATRRPSSARGPATSRPASRRPTRGRSTARCTGGRGGTDTSEP